MLLSNLDDLAASLLFLCISLGTGNRGGKCAISGKEERERGGEGGRERERVNKNTIDTPWSIMIRSEFTQEDIIKHVSFGGGDFSLALTTGYPAERG